MDYFYMLAHQINQLKLKIYFFIENFKHLLQLNIVHNIYIKKQ